MSEAENETLQKGFTGSKYVKVNSDGMYEVKLTNEPSRLFYSVNDALKFELVKTEEKYKRLAAKVKELDKYLRENRSFMLQKDIKKAEDTIKQGLEVLSTYKKRISSLTSEIAKQTIAQQVKEIPQVKNSVLPNSQVFPIADGKSYGNMLNESPLQVGIPGNTAQATTHPAKQESVNLRVTQGHILKATEPIDPKSLPVKIASSTNVKPNFWTRIRNAVKGKRKPALIASGLVLIGTAIAMLSGKKSKQENQRVSDTKSEALQPVTSKKNENLDVKPPVQVLIPSKQIEITPESEVYIVKKGDNLWNIAKRNLIEKNKDDKHYIPSNKEILSETKRILDRNNLKYENDNYLVIIKPGDRLQLAA